jgi:hypothetical protein
MPHYISDSTKEKIRGMIFYYKEEIKRLEYEMSVIPASISWGVKSGKKEAYKEIIKELETFLQDKNENLDNNKRGDN